jgi:hypothetical protein
MNLMYEVGTDDIILVAHRLGKELTVDEAFDIMDELDFYEIEAAVRSQVELEDQTNEVYIELGKQLKTILQVN